jgi:hypothetical protein
VPGAFAAHEARAALERGLNVLVFSDNVPLEEEVALKRLANERGLLLMGPDCGTALIGGTPIAFANAVPRGGIGIVSASGTGLQEVSTLIARLGGGVSHGIGVGGRDLDERVGALGTLAAIEALEADPGPRRSCSFPSRLRSRCVPGARAPEDFAEASVVCFIGAEGTTLRGGRRISGRQEPSGPIVPSSAAPAARWSVCIAAARLRGGAGTIFAHRGIINSSISAATSTRAAGRIR